MRSASTAAAWTVVRNGPMTGIFTTSLPPSIPGSNVFDWITASKPFSAAQQIFRINDGVSIM